MPRPLPPLLLITLIALLLASPVTRAQHDPLSGWPDWVRDSMQAESRRMKFRAVATPDDALRSKLPGKPADPEAFDGGWYFASDIKAQSPLECYIFTGSMDLASLANLMAETNIETITDTHGPLVTRQIFHTGSGEVAGMPYLALEWLYTVKSETQNMVAFTKVRAATKGEVSIACAHNYLGYRDTFARAFAEFVSNAEYADDTPAPYFEEIAQIDVTGLGTGVAYNSYTIDEDGDIKMYAVESSLMATDPATLITSDSYSITYSTPNGQLINAIDISLENGEITSDLRLELNDDDLWVSSGTLQGKTFEAVLDGARSPTSELQQIDMARELFSGDETTKTAHLWIPGIDPSRLLESTMTRDATAEQQAIMTMGPMTATGRFDDEGLLEESDMTIGPVTINLRRIWTNGSFSR